MNCRFKIVLVIGFKNHYSKHPLRLCFSFIFILWYELKGMWPHAQHYPMRELHEHKHSPTSVYHIDHKSREKKKSIKY